MLNDRVLGEIASGMAQMATTYPNDIIANNLARVSMKVESQGYPFAAKLDDLDMQLVRFYLANKNKT